MKTAWADWGGGGGCRGRAPSFFFFFLAKFDLLCVFS